MNSKWWVRHLDFTWPLTTGDNVMWYAGDFSTVRCWGAWWRLRTSWKENISTRRRSTEFWRCKTTWACRGTPEPLMPTGDIRLPVAVSQCHATASCVCVHVPQLAQACGGRNIQDRDEPWGHKGDNRQKRVWADFPAPLLRHPHICQRAAACDAPLHVATPTTSGNCLYTAAAQPKPLANRLYRVTFTFCFWTLTKGDLFCSSQL